MKAARWRELMEQQAFRGILRVAFGMEQSIFSKNVGALHRQKSMGQSSLGGCGKRKAGTYTMQLAKGVATQGGAGNQPSVAVIGEQESNRVRPEQP